MPETKIIIELTRSKPISGSGSALPDAAHDAYYLAKEIPGIQYKGKDRDCHSVRTTHRSGPLRLSPTLPAFASFSVRMTWDARPRGSAAGDA